ncbi:tRNA (adenosine(37)-N6)-threonylcarbamoyltransferase complex dimerization subunit type 1 TsaB [Melaminivora sp.]|uniref:tRNA (adenosine(37)-N6)-threonylcarbamoyltransferase complex dimerization subunit type 1 TsaB n=1 Tax=Melaminivora sp. TaxID=1933032 RepID=UPI0028A7D57E|nr:tRNA (adenosine(37)-N6)-threonylcarbamoyltransferase complex dimerization subunit type 1 TsaB [Melaminivora sp.]
MNLLAFDTSTDTLSIAVQRGSVVHGHTGAGGAQASRALLQNVRALLAQAGLGFCDLDAVVFGRGPGSFTGLRTACSVAQGLAFGARGGQGVPVLPVDTLLAVAEQTRAEHGASQIVATLDARMDEVYWARWSWQDDGTGGQWTGDGEIDLCPPQELAVPQGWVVAGNARASYGDRLAPGARHLCALPTADALLRLAPTLLARGEALTADAALPLYVRDKVAQTTAERDAARRASAGPRP